MSRHRPQQGVALLSVLLICVLVTLIVSTMLARQRLSLHSSANLQQQQQLWQLALSGEAWARQQLLWSLREEGALQVTHLQQRWAQAAPELQVGGGVIRVQLSDLSARFNLNSLLDNNPTQRSRYQRLLAQQGIKTHDPSLLLQQQGLADVTELQQLPQASPALLLLLEPLVVAMPRSSLNINTAPAQLLACIEGIDAVTARTLASSRPRQGYPNLAAFLANPMLQGRDIQPQGLTVSSRQFRATVDVLWQSRRLRLISDLQVLDNQQVRVRQRSLQPSPAHPSIAP
ncbi:general secretion pathway protein GspK [Pseudomonas sp. 5P_3.1_Bac2]|uniref:general secretion pathway protein GspK n=1 Tax=Pseudomonas sp. 5P_3.1_Bac2 TaxID=2971617 RepID=UPI0021C599AB|nr:type II secretion system protein GspK [Pseudomonas sp. 5P_3.1_Bac2]MCU1717742.1 type II secretion system protein GspK [Pseudomonas sp. 5P_3.1_Bac2]